MAARILLIEGKDDLHVIRHLCNAHALSLNGVDVKYFGDAPDDEGAGIEHLVRQVPIWLKSSDLERLAVVVDADEDAMARWQSLRDRLRAAGVTSIPDSPSADGTIAEIDDGFSRRQLGVWIMPSNILPGNLESFLAFLVPEGDDLLPLVDELLGRIPVESRRFSEPNVPKARIHCYLALQREPGKPLGLAIAFRFLDPDCDAALPFVRWLKSTLDLSSVSNRQPS